jgi:hypothetical protein
MIPVERRSAGVMRRWQGRTDGGYSDMPSQKISVNVAGQTFKRVGLRFYTPPDAILISP